MSIWREKWMRGRGVAPWALVPFLGLMLACGSADDVPGMAEDSAMPPLAGMGGTVPSVNGVPAAPGPVPGNGDAPPAPGATPPSGSSGGEAGSPGSGSGDGNMPGTGDGDMPAMGDGDMPAMGDGDMPGTGDGDMPGDGTGDGDMPGADPTDADYAGYHDPGTGPWEMGSPDECRMDVSQIQGRGNIAVFRYGKLCFIQGGNTSGSNFSATKTLGGVLAGRAAYLVKDVPRTGPGTGPILHEDLAVDWLGRVSYNSEARLTHVMSMTAFNRNLDYGSKRFSYDTFGTREISSIVDVAMTALEQLDGRVPTSASTFMRQEVFDRLGMEDSRWSGGTIGTGWTGTLEDMGRMGVMLVHDGWWNGERFMEASWVYRMSHPAHEDANTSYGQLAWLNHRGNAAGIGGDIASGSNSREGDPCAPAAFWPSYPHVGSAAPDCRSTVGDRSCEQTHDVGVFSAQGLNGQFVVMHPGLDLVIVAHNFSNSGGPMGMWELVRPAVVAADPMFAGDEAAFCEAYGAGDYAPDLQVPRVAPTP